jgi:hypothetical protein
MIGEYGLFGGMVWETEILEEDLSLCCFVHHKSHMPLLGIETGPMRCEAEY